ncbi:hypothetical protein FOG94_12260 [Cellulosimicrobium cellulans]|uniref:Uncharacterized protein n=1 Tax=Cellulosimicrobium cellulans TaxID=1710 RepID=A0ABX5XHS9_CELCE|nr:hypothetical protein FOG94_12260 [Cellulosimicrobium cellulans]
MTPPCDVALRCRSGPAGTVVSDDARRRHRARRRAPRARAGPPRAPRRRPTAARGTRGAG